LLLPLPQQVTDLKVEATSQEQRYHLLTCQLAGVDHSIRRLTSGPAAERLRDRLSLRVSEAEEGAKELREQQRQLKEAATTGASQIDMMNDLLRLLQASARLVCECTWSRSGYGRQGQVFTGMAGKAKGRQAARKRLACAVCLRPVCALGVACH
jgi:hypothetical protein